MLRPLAYCPGGAAPPRRLHGVLLTVTIIAHNASGDGPESEPSTITLS